MRRFPENLDFDRATHLKGISPLFGLNSPAKVKNVTVTKEIFCTNRPYEVLLALGFPVTIMRVSTFGAAASLCAVVVMFQGRRTGEVIRGLTSFQRPESGEPDDRTLLDALRRRDPDALSIVYARYHRSMVGLATLYLGNLTTAEEVVQETWLAAINALPKFEGRSSLRTWLFRILAKRASKHIRHESLLATILSRRSRAIRAPLARRFTASGNWTVSPAQSSLNPEEQLLSREMTEWVRKAVASLPRRQREVVYLRDIEGWSSEDVCEFLRITSGHQRVLLHRAHTGLYNLYLSHISQKGSQPKSET